MYVIFPADEVVQLSFGRPASRQRQQQRSGQRCYCNQHRTVQGKMTKKLIKISSKYFLKQ